MYEVDHNTPLSDIPDNISNLLTELKEYREDFNIEVEYSKNQYKITLRELTLNRELNTTRCILMEISDNPCFYSIQMFTNHAQNSNNRELKRIYDIEVEGENDYRLIKKDVSDLIEGKKGTSFTPNFPL